MSFLIPSARRIPMSTWSLDSKLSRTVRFEQHGPQAEKPVKIAICEYRRSKSFEDLCLGTIPINGSERDRLTKKDSTAGKDSIDRNRIRPACRRQDERAAADLRSASAPQRPVKSTAAATGRGAWIERVSSGMNRRCANSRTHAAARWQVIYESKARRTQSFTQP
jgi:hypothetical protein